MWAWGLLGWLGAAGLPACGDSSGGGAGVPIDTGAAEGFSFPTTDGGMPLADPGGQPTPDAGPVPDLGPSPDPGAETAGGCPDGTACNDHDPCTFNDQCQGGVCQGTPIDCGPDDGAPCTYNKCVDGACQAGVEAGFCYVDGACWSDGQPNPTNACQTCQAMTQPQGWTAGAGACDDGDPCTQLDSCQSGVCAGTPIACTDDGNPCTDNICVGGACQAVAKVGQPCDDGDGCTLNDACGAGGACLPGAPKDADGDGVVDQVCGGTDCDDTSAQAKPGLTEVCNDGLDNDCDGLTDAEQDVCTGTGGTKVGLPCSYHTDCYPEAVCAVWAATGQAKCSAPCAGPADCEAGQVCSKLPGSAQVGFCQAPRPGGAANGAACTQDGDCGSMMCANSQCVSTCLSEGYCQGAPTCSIVGDLSIGYVSGACAPDAAGTLPNNAVCTDGSGYASMLCASGHCDFMYYGVTGGVGEPRCAPLCKTQLDCASNQECGIVIYSSTPNPDALLYDPVVETSGTAGQKAPRDAQTACYTRTTNAPGNVPDGTPCSSPASCQGGQCLPLLPSGPTTYCTRYCTHDGDCLGAGMKCKLEMTTMASTFLQNYGGADFPASTSFWTYVRVCKFE